MLVEYWQRGKDLVVCCANLLPEEGREPLTLHLPGVKSGTVAVHTYPGGEPSRIPLVDGRIQLRGCPRLTIVEAKDCGLAERADAGYADAGSRA